MKKLGIILILCLVLVFSVVGGLVTGSTWADDASRPYPIMHPDWETLEQWIDAYDAAPLVHIEMEEFQVPSPGGSLSLLHHLEYTADERDQGNCGNCWAWAGTGCLGIALDVQEGINDRLSVQYINSCGYETSGKPCCDGGWLSDVVDFYTATGMAIPWSNTNAYWQGCTACDTISTTPEYPIASMQEETVETHGEGQATAIANIKNVLNQNKAIWFAFFLPTGADWGSFFNFWNYEAENAIWNPDFSCGHTWVEGGGHAVLCVGYNDEDPENKYWIMLNSWGTGPTGNRPSGLFRLDMDMNYDCCFYAPPPNGYYSFYWQTLDVTFGANNPPQLSNPSVQPPSGTPSTGFYYSVHYYDSDGDSPTRSRVYIDSTPYTMSLQSGSASDGVYRYGPKNLAASSHSYYFYFQDGKGGTARLPSSGSYSGPTVSQANNPPSLPGNPSPANHATGVSINADLSWIGGDPDAGDTVTYDVYFDTTGATTLVSNEQSATTYDPGTLGYGTKYYWKIVATDSQGASTTGPLWDFTTGPVPNNSPQLSNPSVQPPSGTPSTGFYYSVHYYDSDGDSPTRSRVYIDSTPYTMSLQSGSASDGVYRYGPKNLAASSHSYYFYFQDGKGGTARLPSSGSYSGPTVSQANNPPSLPGNPSPANHATGVSINADLSWIGGDPDAGDTVTYDVYFGASATPPLVSNDHTGTSYDPGALDNNVTYYWKIVAADNHGAPTTGPVWDFTTQAEAGRKGDFDNDGQIDIVDFCLFVAAYGSKLGDDNYNPAGDFDDNGDIDIVDFCRFAVDYGI